MKEYLALFALLLWSVETTTILPTNGNVDLQSHVLQLEQTVSGLQSYIQVQDQKYAAVLSSVLSKLTTTTAELTGVKAELNTAKTELTGLKTDLSGVETELGRVKTDFSILNNDHQSLQKEFIDLKTKCKSKESEILHLRTAMNSAETKLTSVVSSMKLSNRSIGVLQNEAFGIKSYLNRTMKSLNDFTNVNKKLKADANMTDARLNLVDYELKTVASNLTSAQSSIKSVVSGQANLTSTVKDIKDDVSQLKGDNTDPYSGCSLDNDTMETKQNNSDVECPMAFHKHGNSCYHFSRTYADFGAARSLCLYLSSHLAVITSKGEDDFLRGYLLKNGHDHDFITGGTDLRKEGTWTWTCSERNMTYTNWNPGQPKTNKKGQHCLGLFHEFGYEWNDTECDEQNRFICERKL